MQPSLQTEATYPSSGRFYPVEYGVQRSRRLLHMKEAATRIAASSCSVGKERRRADAVPRRCVTATPNVYPWLDRLNGFVALFWRIDPVQPIVHLGELHDLLTTSHPRTKETFR